MTTDAPPPRRLLLLGGGAGTGKSTVARVLADRTGAGWLQLDTVWIALREAQLLTSGTSPVDIDGRIRAQTDCPDDLVEAHLVASKVVCAALPHVLELELQAHPVLVADGSWLLPDFVRTLVLPMVQISAAFLHQPDHSELARAMASRRDRARAAPWDADSTRVACLYGDRIARDARTDGLPVVQAQPYACVVDRVQAAMGLASAA